MRDINDQRRRLRGKASSRKFKNAQDSFRRLQRGAHIIRRRTQSSIRLTADNNQGKNWERNSRERRCTAGPRLRQERGGGRKLGFGGSRNYVEYRLTGREARFPRALLRNEARTESLRKKRGLTPGLQLSAEKVNDGIGRSRLPLQRPTYRSGGGFT